MDLKTNDSAGALATGSGAAVQATGGARPLGGTDDLSSPSAASLHALPEHPLVRVRPQGFGPAFDLRELWDFRELLFFLTWRDLKVRYKQTVLGVAWVIVQPVLTMIAFTIFFNRLGGFRSEGLPYPLFAYSGLLLWTFFSNAVIYGTNSLIQNSNG